MVLSMYMCVCVYIYIYIERERERDREGNGAPLQYSCLENPMDGRAWKAAVHGVTKGRTRLSDFPFTFHFHALEKEMATHSSVLAWRIPGTGEPGGLPSTGSHRVALDWSDLAAQRERERSYRCLYLFYICTSCRLISEYIPKINWNGFTKY